MNLQGKTQLSGLAGKQIFLGDRNPGSSAQMKDKDARKYIYKSTLLLKCLKIY